jgi:hypothetical protein
MQWPACCADQAAYQLNERGAMALPDAGAGCAQDTAALTQRSMLAGHAGSASLMPAWLIPKTENFKVCVVESSSDTLVLAYCVTRSVQIGNQGVAKQLATDSYKMHVHLNVCRHYLS